MTMPLHCLLYSAMPILATSSGPLIPKVLSISYSCEKAKQARQSRGGVGGRWRVDVGAASGLLPQASRGSPSRIVGPRGSHSDGQSG